MSKLTVVYDGWWGSSGKGDVCVAIAAADAPRSLVSVRVGGSNAGHTILDAKGVERKVQSIPVTAFTRRDGVAVLGASAVIDRDILYRELGWLDEAWDGDPPPVVVDTNATYVSEMDHAAEHDLKRSISSTGEGVGSATAAKVMRRAGTFQMLLESTAHHDREAQHMRELLHFTDTVRLLNGLAIGSSYENFQGSKVDLKNTHILIEGTQGVLLSLNTGGFYPYCTSRDCTPEAILGQVGLSTRAFPESEIICVMRTFPIRVGGPSGPLPNEISWEDLYKETGGYVSTPELTTVSKKQRRIARWDPSLAEHVVRMTRPTSIALSFLDYVDPAVVGMDEGSPIPLAAIRWIIRNIGPLEVPLSWIGIGPHKYRRFMP